MKKQELIEIFNEAREQAFIAAGEFFNDKLGGVDKGACGFAWVNVVAFEGKRIDGRTKLGRMFIEAGLSTRVWNPACSPVQNIDTLEAGAAKFVEVLESKGFTAFAESRLD